MWVIWLTPRGRQFSTGSEKYKLSWKNITNYNSNVEHKIYESMKDQIPSMAKIESVEVED